MNQRKSGFYLEMSHNPNAILNAMAQMREDMRRAASSRQLKRIVGWVLIIIGGVTMIASCGLLSNSKTVPFAIGAGVFTMLIFAAGWIVLSLAGPPVAINHLDEAYRLLYALQDDIGPKGQVIGWLDLTGPQQSSKEERRSSSRSGKTKVYYRDLWLRVRFKLIDGNLMRMSIEDRVKTKSGVIVQYRTKLSAKLVVNPEQYQIGATPRKLPLPSATVARTDRDLTLSAEFTARNKPPALPTDHILETLKVMYNTLKPAFPTAVQG